MQPAVLGGWYWEARQGEGLLSGRATLPRPSLALPHGGPLFLSTYFLLHKVDLKGFY